MSRVIQQVRTSTLRSHLPAILLSLVLVSAPLAPAQVRRQPDRRTNEIHKTRLVLLIVVDQFRYDYLERFGDLFVANGLRRLVERGASWVDANYDHIPTNTAPGHSTLMTGAYPASTGIVGNEWPDRETGKRVTSVSDESVRSLGGGPNEMSSSPKRLMASTLGDELRIASADRSKVIGISVKDRSAILPPGRHANAAYWLSIQSGNMVSSSYYFSDLPAWVQKFNQTRPADKYFGAKWERLLPEAEYLKRAGLDSPPWENIRNAVGDTNAFPHIITGGATAPGRDFYTALDRTPFVNDVLLSFSEQAIINEKLGQRNETDLLTVSFSGDDYVGHRYGPYSQEMMDVTLRVDRQIASLLDIVDKQVGLANTIVLLSADHGMAPIPEQATAMGLPGGRIKNETVIAAIRAAISARYNPHNKTPDPTADYIWRYIWDGKTRDAINNNNIYFDLNALKRDGISLEEITQVAGQAALTVPGIARYFTRSDLIHGNVGIDPLARRAMHGFYSSRSGDLVLVQQPFYYLNDDADPASHGSGYSYDTHVPLIIMGGPFIPGRYYQAATPADLAPTLAAVLGVQPPSNNTGRVLFEALPQPARAAAH